MVSSVQKGFLLLSSYQLLPHSSCKAFAWETGALLQDLLLGRYIPQNQWNFQTLESLFLALREKLDLHKFTRCKYDAKKVQTRSKSKAKMVNTAFACLFTWGCKFEGKCGIYHLCLTFNLSLQFFAQICTE